MNEVPDETKIILSTAEVLEPSDGTIFLSLTLLKISLEESIRHVGILYGFRCEECICCISAVCVEKFTDSVIATFPSGISPVGFFCLGLPDLNPQQLKVPNELLKLTSEVLDHQNNTEAVNVVLFGTNMENIATYVLDSDGTLKKISYHFVDPSTILKNFNYHLITMDCSFYSVNEPSHIMSNVDLMKEKLNSSKLAFSLDSPSCLLRCSENKNISCLSVNNKTFEPHDNFDKLFDKKEKKKKETEYFSNEIDLEWIVLQHFTSKEYSHAPIIKYTKGNFNWLQIVIPIRGLAIIHKKDSFHSVYHKLKNALLQQLCLWKSCLCKIFEEKKNFAGIEIFHFFPNVSGTLISVAYPQNYSEDELESWRFELHQKFLLTFFYPQFRRLCRWNKTSAHIRNPHLILLKKPCISIVRGTYEYYHYLHDGIQDEGWGCAYRSLQTIVSWLRYQGYTNKEVPTHLQIQQALVSIGDKEATFAGSRQWIGSIEVSYVLEYLYGITSCILFVNSGSELADKGRELQIHFRNYGSPIMIGGGVLAHTILGIDFNPQTGATRFLILDPHYMHADDIQSIVTHGGCLWKGSNFWSKTCYYNLCLPLPPQCI